MISGEQKFLAVLSHLAYLLGIGLIIVPLIIVLLKKSDSFVHEHAKQALIAQTMFVLCSTIVMFLVHLLIGILLIPFLCIVGAVFFITSLVAAYKAMKGDSYDYPLIQSIARNF
ncbi:protein of unknown function [Propionispira arboris]|uniref:DUF4870 domain-containing protein n=1 Tax=Propionispira arboris TaxID=84035 RepID=A0A1H7B8P8_9FIRM|nr:DUF4870 domain-containing protein [Propionispira arboris]SEJ70832.1 protein of unknown function [Propionispira arboris]